MAWGPDATMERSNRNSTKVNLAEKVSFTFGVLCVVLTPVLVLRQPHWFMQVTSPQNGFFNTFHISVPRRSDGSVADIQVPNSPPFTFLPVSFRLIDYVGRRHHLHILDLSHFLYLSVSVQTSHYPQHLLWFKACNLVPLLRQLIGPTPRQTLHSAWGA